MGLLDGARSFMEKLGYFGDAEDEQDEEELAQEADDEAEAYADEDEEPSEPLLGRFLNPLTGRRRKMAASDQAEEEETAAFSAEPRAPLRDNVIRDERLTGRLAQTTAARHVEHVITVRQIEECREIIKCLLRGESVLLNLENVDPKDCGRIVDLLSGAAFALQGRMLKLAHLSYLLAPQSVEIVEDKEPASLQSRYR